jgi:hypothetical protein
LSKAQVLVLDRDILNLKKPGQSIIDYSINVADIDYDFVVNMPSRTAKD